MNLFGGILNGLGELWAHKLRSALTICCVLLGVASMVVTTGFMDGLFAVWGQSLEEQGGPEKITGSPSAVEERQEPFAQLSRGFRFDDVRLIRRLVPEARYIAPEIEGNPRINHGRKRGLVRTQGVTNDSFVINRYEVAQGRAFNDLDLLDRASVIILGSEIRKRFFDETENPIGQFIDLDNKPFRVIGVMRAYERFYGKYNVLNWKNDIAFIPVTTMAAKVQRSDRLSYLNVKAGDITALPDTIDALENVFRHQHRGIVDYKAKTNEQALASYTQTKSAFVIGGGAIAGVSLLVSGIGIMNLMLASINERVREIGIRKALGATPANIFSQFVTEAVTLSLVGGVFGVLAASGLIKGLQAVLPPGNAPLLSPTAFVVGFGFSVVAGVVAGVYPAIQAAKLDPIDALRYE
ncbi:hypothetical protein IMCC26134_10700 [Verrucomicrobia bacterium IMCC26134]|jgi:ABC-type antimicrobial peptide transport system permease subunit|nr:hypothetical protein IMCC26134_10700 [Verrucomicrobia bacterium IMCC26134]